MTRMSKQGKRRAMSPRKHKAPRKKTGPLKDNLPLGYKAHENALDGEYAKQAFIPKIR